MILFDSLFHYFSKGFADFYENNNYICSVLNPCVTVFYIHVQHMDCNATYVQASD